jgi:hypothetical protein
MIKCISHKRCYLAQEIAEEALIEARANFDYGKGNGPVAVYRCEDCGYYHLTSSGTMNNRLAESIKSGKIQLQKEANKWIGKMKKK